MKELLDILLKDIASDDFTTREYIIYGIVAPLVLIAGCVVATIISNL